MRYLRFYYVLRMHIGNEVMKKVLQILAISSCVIGIGAKAGEFRRCPDDPNSLYKIGEGQKAVYWIIPFNSSNRININKTFINLANKYAPTHKPRYICESSNCITSDGQRFSNRIQDDRGTHEVIPSQSGALIKVSTADMLNGSNSSLADGVSCKYKYLWGFDMRRVYRPGAYYYREDELPYIQLIKQEVPIMVTSDDSKQYRF